MHLRFHKLHGAGNDFVLLDLRAQDFNIDAQVARDLADRHTGVGCDQLLVILEPRTPGSVAAFDVWNADGSKAEQCGNGVRCIALYLSDNGDAPEEPFWLDGPVNRIGVEIAGPGQVRVNMREPEFEPARIPFRAGKSAPWYALALDDGEVQIGAVSMGNPHAVTVVEDLDDPEIERRGPAISRHSAFPQGCNAGFARIVDRHRIELRVFERGAGETRACGSGACAAVAVLTRAGLLDRNVTVVQAGGQLVVDWAGMDAPIMKTGPAVHLYEGNLL